MKKVASGFLLCFLAFALVTSAMVHKAGIDNPGTVLGAIAAAPIAPDAYAQRLKEAVDFSPDTELEFTHAKPVWEDYSMTYTEFSWSNVTIEGAGDILPAVKTLAQDLFRYFGENSRSLARLVPNTINNVKNYFKYYLACVRDLADYVAEVLPFRHITVKYWKHVLACLIPADWQKLIDEGVYVNEWYTDEYTAHRGGR